MITDCLSAQQWVQFWDDPSASLAILRDNSAVVQVMSQLPRGG